MHLLLLDPNLIFSQINDVIYFRVNPELKDLQALLDRTVLTVLMVLTELLVWTVAMVPMEKKEKLDPSDPLVYL